MLARILLATASSAVESRFRQLTDRPNTIVEVVSGGGSLWEKVSRENFDLVIVSRSLIGSSASETVSSLANAARFTGRGGPE